MNQPSQTNKQGSLAKNLVKKIPLATRPHVQPTERKGQFAITIGKTPDEVYAFWRDFKNLPLFMKALTSIEVLDSTTSKWTITLKSGQSTSWTAKITADQQGKMISWKSLEGSEVETSGSIWFSKAPADLGCIVEVAMDYRVPGGKLTEIAALLTGEDPKNLTLTNLKRLKAFLETGEIATTEGQPSGREEMASKKNLH